MPPIYQRHWARHRAVFFALVPILASFTHALHAQTIWDGGGGDNLWTNPLNWNNDDVPDTAIEDVRIDNDTETDSTVSLSVAPGTTLDVGVVTVDAGDTLSITGQILPGSTLNLAGLLNSGTTNYGVSASNNNAATSLNVGGTGTIFNAADSLLNIRNSVSRNRVHLRFQISADNQNDGDIVSSLVHNDRNTTEFRLSGSGTFVNNGTITIRYEGVNSSSAVSRFRLLTADSTVTLGGNGVLILDEVQSTANHEVHLIGTSGTSVLTNGAEHTIQGVGLIGGNNLNVINDGLINATGDNEDLTLTPSTTLQNNGELRASGAAGLLLTSGAFTNDGLITVLDGSKLLLTSTASLINQGTLDIDGGLGGSGTLSSDSSLTISDTGSLLPGESPGTFSMEFEEGERLILSGLTELFFELDTPGVVGGGVNDLILIDGGLTLDGLLNISALAGFGEGLYTLFQFDAGSLIDNGLDLALMPEGYNYELLTDDSLGLVQLEVTAVPQPSSACLALLGLMGIALMRRRAAR